MPCRFVVRSGLLVACFSYPAIKLIVPELCGWVERVRSPTSWDGHPLPAPCEPCFSRLYSAHVPSLPATCSVRAPYTLRFRRLPHWLFRWSFRPVFLFVKNKNVKTVPAVCFFRGECVFSRPQLIISHDLKLLMPWSNFFSGWFQPLPCWLLVSLGTFIAR